jgi:Zn-dependent membrane protease YugP
MYTIDLFYILLSIPALLIAVLAQILIRYFYSKYSQVPNSKGINGIQAAELISRKYGFDFRLSVSMFTLSDHYNPFSSILTLSEQVARLPTIASIGIVAHELGHVQQHQSGGILLRIRNMLIPVVNIGTTLGYLLFVLGIALQFFSLLVLGIILFSLSTLFTLITLPIEIDASNKAMNFINELQLLTPNEIDGAKKVLFAAVLTYIAAAFQSLTSLFYYILRILGMRRRR